MIAFVAVFMAVLAEARLGGRNLRTIYDGLQDVRDDVTTFDEAESIFDKQTRFVKKAPKGRFNNKGYVVRKNLGGGKGNPKVKNPGQWVKQTSHGEGKDEMFDEMFDQDDEAMFDKHWYKKPDFSSLGKKGSRRTRDEMFDEMFDQDDEAMFDKQTRYVKKVPKGRGNQKGYVVRKNLGGGKGNPKVKDPNKWLKQTSYGEGKRL